MTRRPAPPRPARHPPKPVQRRRGTGPAVPRGDAVLLYGVHAVAAALANPERRPIRLHASDAGVARLAPQQGEGGAMPVPVVPTAPPALDRMVDGAPHQGLVLETQPLPPADLTPLLPQARRLVMLDQVTDPHNVGAVFRSAKAFGAEALIAQDRHAPPESGVLAKAASGTLETLPWVRVTNLARALETLAAAGFWRLGLDGAGEGDLARLTPPDKWVLVLGAEGRGLRPNVARHCDGLVRIALDPAVESLNVSNAAAVALFALQRPHG